MPITNIGASFTLPYIQYKRTSLTYDNPLSGASSRPVRVVIEKANSNEFGDVIGPFAPGVISSTDDMSWSAVGTVDTVNAVLNEVAFQPAVKVPGTEEFAETVVYIEPSSVTGTFNLYGTFNNFGLAKNRRAQERAGVGPRYDYANRISRWDATNSVIYVSGTIEEQQIGGYSIGDTVYGAGPDNGKIALIKQQPTAGTYLLLVRVYYDDPYKTTPDATATITLVGTEFNLPPSFTVEPPSTVDVAEPFVLGEVDDPVDRILELKLAMKYHPNDPAKSGTYILDNDSYGYLDQLRVNNRISGFIEEDGIKFWRFIGTIDECNEALRRIRYVAGSNNPVKSFFVEIRVSDGVNMRARSLGTL